MRSLALLAGLAVIAGAVVIKTLPEGQAEADPQPGRPQEVQSVAIDGRGLPTAALRASLSTHAGEPVESAKLEADRAALEHVLVARGYLAAKVEPAQVSYDSYGAAYVTFAVAQGPLFHVRSVKVTGAAERDAGSVTLARGEAVDAERLERARTAIADRLAARGKRVDVEVRMTPDQGTHGVDVELAAR